MVLWAVASQVALVLGTLLVAHPAVVRAWFRVSCAGVLVEERVDPIRFPGVNVPSQHVHTVHGASDFHTNSTFESLRRSECTNCQVKEDLSNYWFPKLYFRDPTNDNVEPVPNGGLLVYYQNRGSQDRSSNGTGLRAFPPGFRMMSGDPARRSRKRPRMEGSQAELRERALQWSCLRYPDNEGYDDEGRGFPTTDCESGFNARIHMPACWDGRNNDSPDHMAHTAYLSGLDNGSCPGSHPVGLMKLFYEVTWDVHHFADRWTPGTDNWPFVYSTGDSSGYSWHGDFLNGWDTEVLQNAIDNCNNPGDATGSGDTSACRFLTVIPGEEANKCRIRPAFDEDVNGVNGTLSMLPGCNPVQRGPVDALLYTEADCPFEVPLPQPIPRTNGSVVIAPPEDDNDPGAGAGDDNQVVLSRSSQRCRLKRGARSWNLVRA
ncbi:hypothetical protein FA15DRAFT_670095 [Coprinopsis marcescibilis]|uniref:DUF1996 domain-containing protein n=1 Tax=Coprinopsis marcescibilis TaxID=230819 RepID=A0A5C3KTP2_COPMA|nr:hypothetical protein FA15DRAFT_670095 [Coprinopsis marcescibilis]